MCTVSILPTSDGARVVCNRDEQRSRPAAVFPTMHRAGTRRALYPVDPAGGGTWIGVNDAGVMLVLLNRTTTHADPSLPRTTRGAIIPSLLATPTFDAAVVDALAMRISHYAPFRLLICRGARLAVLDSDGRTLTMHGDRIDRPLLFTSSSLGDHLVDRPRRQLFDEMVLEAAPGDRLRAQTRFHRHQWPSHPALSVLMSRPDACTVSRTVVVIAGEQMLLRYEPLRIH